MDINKKIKNLRNRKRVTEETIEDIREWWSNNVDVIGRKVGKYELINLKYATAYGGMYEDYITIYGEYMVGHGYTGYSRGNDYNTYSMKKANRQQHIDFFKDFFQLLQEKLKEVEDGEKFMNSVTFKTGKE